MTLTFNHVSFTYPGQMQSPLKDIHFSVASGECILLCGRSGCGKTTLTRLVNGLIPHVYPGQLEGTVLIDGQDTLLMPMYAIAKRVGSVFQNPRTQFFNVDTDSEIVFGLENEAVPPAELAQRLEETTADLALQSLRQRSIFQLSGGEKQKIAFASVYAMQADIYLLDEPSSNLDMASTQALKEDLRQLKAQGKTIIIAEHRLYYLLDLADRILYLEDGRITASFTPDQLGQLSPQKRAQLGLRTTNLLEVLPPAAPVMRSAEPLLTLEMVSSNRGSRPVLEPISLSASAGEIIGIAGHNGAGKTTFSRVLCGLHRESGGQFYWRQQGLTAKERLRRSYLVMQDVNYQLFAESVEAECTFGIKKPDFRLLDTALRELGLIPYRKQHPNTLSGGQKQRVAIACSLLCAKDLLVFDEPTSGLDFDSMQQIAELLKKLSQMGKVIFVVTHDFEFMCRTCSRLLHFAHGKLLADLPVQRKSLPQLRQIFALSPERRDD